ncbi:hypothetical protein CVT26_008646 [Gymnopilus dilepis]|uniref:Uncharacterized protein n=1 Tax=Gymnopilus dilepis TaxID=231916 RepID=A0A409XXX4_9AGAR|nr:hypothetical protein CVT26_008646 [Gymnopilus dilepis]
MQAITPFISRGLPRASQENSIETLFPLSDASLKLFDTFPVEVISTVFLHYKDYKVTDRSHGPLARLKLGRICRRWRQIAWSTPRLWAELYIDREHATSQTHVELAKEWLGRSGTLPLSIQYYSKNCNDRAYGGIVPQVYKQMFEAIARCSDRWYSLTLGLPSALLEDLGSLPLPTSTLHDLALHASWQDDDNFCIPNYPRIATFFQCSPKVVDIACLNAALNWTSVTVLKLELVDVAEVLFIFQTASNLSDCSLLEVVDRGSDMSTVTERGLITCPVLKDLFIQFGDGQAPADFCNVVSLPALKYLLFESFEDYDIEFSMNDVITLLSQSLCPLKKLHINEAEFEAGSLTNVAPLLSSLTELHITFCPAFFEGHSTEYDAFDAFYQFLANPGQSATHPLLPHLEKFEWVGNKPYLWETIPGLLEPASHTGASYSRPLRLVSIHCHEPPSAHIPDIPMHVVRQLLEYPDVKFDFMVELPEFEHPGRDWWKAALERWDASTAT